MPSHYEHLKLLTNKGVRMAERALTYKELRTEKIKKSRSTLWALEKDGKFPKRRRQGGRVYWLESEIDAWLKNLEIA